MKAASSYASSMVIRKLRTIRMKKPLAMVGRISAHRESSSPRLRTTSHKVMKPPEKTIVIRITTVMKVLPGSRFFDSG